MLLATLLVSTWAAAAALAVAARSNPGILNYADKHSAMTHTGTGHALADANTLLLADCSCHTSAALMRWCVPAVFRVVNVKHTACCAQANVGTGAAITQGTLHELNTSSRQKQTPPVYRHKA